MKGLVKKVLAPALVAGAVLLPNSADAQEQQVQPTSPTYYSAEIVLYKDDDSKVTERYAPIWGFGGRIIKDFSRNFRGEIAASSYGGKGEFQYEGYTGESSLRIINIEGMFKYREGEWSWGAGPVILNTRERGSIGGFSDVSSGSGFGLILGGGWDLGEDGSGVSINFEYLSMFTGPELSGGRVRIGITSKIGN